MLVESESQQFLTWLAGRDEPLVGSELLSVEAVRACRRADPGTVGNARSALTNVDLVPLTSALLADAAELPDPLLRSLDAVHLASALSIRDDVSAFVAYDRRLADAAAATGLHVVAPGT